LQHGDTRDIAPANADSYLISTAILSAGWSLAKIPGTAAGLPAIRQLLTEGLNINITLLFARDRYEEWDCWRARAASCNVCCGPAQV